MHIFDAQEGGKLRALVRALVVCVTAFGLKLDGDQVAAVQLVLEAVIALLTASPIGDAPVDGGGV